MNPVWTMEEANLFCGSSPDDNQASNHLVITELKLPAMDMNYVDHRPGGARVAVEISTIANRLEMPFVCLGLQPQIIQKLWSWQGSQNFFTAYGVIRDQLTGELAQAVAVIEGQLGRFDPQNWTKGGTMHTNYSLRSVMHYELNIAGQQIVYFDFGENALVIGDTDLNAQINAYLHIPQLNVVPAIQNVGAFVPGT